MYLIENCSNGFDFDPIILMSSQEIQILSEDEDVTVNTRNGNKKNKRTVVISSDESDEPSMSKNNNRNTVNGLARNKKKRSTDDDEVSFIGDESESDVSIDENEISESDEAEKSESSSASSEHSKRKITRSGTSRKRRRLASVSSLESLPSTDSEEERKKTTRVTKTQKKTVDSDSDVELNRNRAKRTRIESDNEDDDPETRKKRRSRKLLTQDKLEKQTVDAVKAEKERRERLEARQREFNGIEFVEGEETGFCKKLKSIILDDDSKSSSPNPVAVHSELVKLALPHQADGIKFMYDNVVESLEIFRKETERSGGRDGGGGGILAHCMGLGKTFTTIAFVHTILTHSELNKVISKVLVVVPKNVVLNWKNEFDKWLLQDGRFLDDFEVYELDSLKQDVDRLVCLRNWHKLRKPAIMIIGYDLFRILTACDEDQPKKKPNHKPKKLNKKQKKFKELQIQFRKHLHEAPDLVICDEGHKLKNDESILSKTMMRVHTKRRICLTGTPLQNNLSEYHVMVSFVKPGLLGTKAEFANRFSNPINRGRTKDAGPMEVAFMKRRCHVLYEQLKHVVQRKEISVLQTELPEKQEFVIYIRLTEAQIKLYELFLAGVDKTGGFQERKRLLADYYELARIWTHPFMLIAHAREAERKAILNEDQGDLNGFIVESEEDETDESSGDDDVGDNDDNSDADDNNKTGGVRKSKRLAGETVEIDNDRELTPLSGKGWWTKHKIFTEEDEYNLRMSNKLLLLIEIIKKCESIGDKLLVFSQSLESLRMIKNLLKYMDDKNLWFTDEHECLAANGEKWGWREGFDYLVIDGSVGIYEREYLQTRFNNKRELRARLMLISTRAGGIGINLTAANRVVIFDACWNPSHDTQSLFRVYRIGQTKPTYIYRLIAQGTMEERIYKRQVTKESTSLRVVDEYQIQRHFAGHDLEELYTLDPIPYIGTHNMAPPKDKLLGDMILTHPECIVDYIIHDTLFENQESEKLTADECVAAWQDYENEKNGRSNTIPDIAAMQSLLGSILNSSSNSNILSIHSTASNSVPGPSTMNSSTISNLSGSTLANMASRIKTNLTSCRFAPELEKCIPVDPIFLIASSKGYSADQCRKLAYMKLALDKMLEMNPRNDVAQFGTFFESLMEGRTGQVAMIKGIEFFLTSKEIFKRGGNATVKQYIDYLEWVSKWMFNVPKIDDNIIEL